MCQVGEIKSGELDRLRPGAVVCGFHHLAVAPHEKLARLIELEMTLIGYEILSDGRGNMPVLYPFSRMAGQLVIQVDWNGFLVRANHAQAMGPILDPTLAKEAGGRLDTIIRLAGAFADAADVAHRIVAEHERKLSRPE